MIFFKYVSISLYLSMGCILAGYSSSTNAEIPTKFFGEWEVYDSFSTSEKTIGKLLLFKNSYLFEAAVEPAVLVEYISHYRPVPLFIEKTKGSISLENWPIIIFGDAAKGHSYFVRAEQEDGLVMRLEPRFSVMQNPFIVKRN